MAETNILGWADYFVIAIMLCISAGIGIYYRFSGGRQRTIEEYFVASQTMSVVPVAITLVVSFLSAITILGMSAENYTQGTQFFVLNLSYIVGVPIVCYGFLPVFYKLRATSAYEYLEKRFGVKARMMASVIYWIQMILYSGVALYAPSMALEATTGISKIISVITIGIVCAFYSSIGGIKAVLVTDVFQATLMFAAIIAIIATAVIDAGGFGQIWEIAKLGRRIEFDNISVDPTVRYTWWSLTIGHLVTYLAIYGVNQIQVQRLLTLKNMRASQTALWLSWPILTLFSITICFSGLAIYSKYHDCDPSLQKRIASPDMLMPLYVMDTMSSVPGLPGLFIAGIFSAALSTISSSLNSLAAVTLEDYIRPAYKRIKKCEITAERLTLIAKILAFMFGVVSIALAFLSQALGGLFQASSIIFGVIGGPFLGLFTLGMSTESATEGGAIIGTLTALVFLFWISFGQPRPITPSLPTSVEGCEINELIANATVFVSRNVTNFSKITGDNSYFYLYRISYMWYAPLGFLITFVVGLSFSNLFRMFFKDQRDDLDPNLFFPVIARRYKRRKNIEIDMANDMKLEIKYIFNNANIENVD